MIKEFGLFVNEAVTRLGMSRFAFSRVLNGKAAISTNLSIRLEMAGVSTARAWLIMQTNYDLSKALKRKQPKIDPLSTRLR
ncbi:HigA family addiction module antidote protein [Bartonella koehlerae C-29]|uniref:HigA family addiction module antidote protein n=1 Tax=Bartonella koehlerae C-29 TaxID=1134510 RepID=A0A067W9R7_9HYPH|nr:HigA family addiction module antidote protein [Bartonella koehlerae C-29]